MVGDLDGKVAVVTGAGRLRGIGRAAAVALARLGADVAITGTGRDPATFPEDETAIGWKDIESVAELVQAEGKRALPLVLDVTDPAAVEAAFKQIIAEFGRVDILINNAAVSNFNDRKPVTELDVDLYQRVVDVKLRGSFLCTRAAVRQMYAQDEGGKIVNVASILGKRGIAKCLAYNAANFGLIGMTQSMAREFGPRGINVNCVCPGLVATSRTDPFVSPGDRQHRDKPNDPVPRWGTADEVGAFIAYLCTPAAQFIHGQSINQDGGDVMEH